MMRQLRRSSVVVVFAVLTSIATVYAECSWVLWGTAPDGVGGFMSLPGGAWRDRDECEKERRLKAAQPGPTVMFTCLPDTVDPRGPKGK